MAAVTHLCSLDFVAKVLDEDRNLLEAIIANDDNLTYGAIVTVHTGSDEAITALTDEVNWPPFRPDMERLPRRLHLRPRGD